MSLNPRLRDCGNTLLDRLPAAEFDILSPRFHRIQLASRQVVQQFNAEVESVHFPTSTMLSLLTILEDDDPVEAMTVGHDGFIGLTAALGTTASPHRAICQMAGECIRIPLQSFLEVLARGPELTRIVHRFAAYMLRSTSQTIACNALHTIEARASRWLLMIHDNAGRDEFPMTHEFLAFMLGVRRQSVTVVAGTLQNAGLIQYRRGSVAILDRAGLETAACECYEAVKDYYQKTMIL